MVALVVEAAVTVVSRSSMRSSTRSSTGSSRGC